MLRDSCKRSHDDDDDSNHMETNDEAMQRSSLSSDDNTTSGAAGSNPSCESASKKVRTDSNHPHSKRNVLDLNFPLPQQDGVACHVKVCSDSHAPVQKIYYVVIWRCCWPGVWSCWERLQSERYGGVCWCALGRSKHGRLQWRVTSFTWLLHLSFSLNVQ